MRFRGSKSSIKTHLTTCVIKQLHNTRSVRRSTVSKMSNTAPVTFKIQPPLVASRAHPLFPPPTLLLHTPPTSPFSPNSNNLLAVASAVPASSNPQEQQNAEEYSHLLNSTHPGVLTGNLAVSGTPLQDGTGVAFVFRSLIVREAGDWRIKIALVEVDSSMGSVAAAVLLSTVVKVQQEEVDSQTQLLPDEQQFLDSLNA